MAAQPDYLDFLDNLFAESGNGGHMGYLDNLLSSRAVPVVAGAPENTKPTTAGFSDLFSDYDGPVKYYDGQEFDAKTIKHLASQVAENFDTSGSSGGAFGAKGESIGFDYDEAKKLFKGEPEAEHQVVLDIASRLASYGITDISQVGIDEFNYTVPETTSNGDTGTVTPEHETTRSALTAKMADGSWGYLVPHDVVGQRASYLLPKDDPFFNGKFDGTSPLLDPTALGSTFTGKGKTAYHVGRADDGSLRFSTKGESTSDAGPLIAIASLAAMPFIGPLAASLQGVAPALGAVGSKALVGGLTSGALNAAGGGNFGKGFLGGALGGAISGLNPAGALGLTNKIGASAFNGALGGASGAAVSGGDIGRGLLGGAASGAAAGFNPAGRMGIDNDILRNSVNRGLAGLVGSAVTGSEPRVALLSGAMRGATSGLFGSQVRPKG